MPDEESIWSMVVRCYPGLPIVYEETLEGMSTPFVATVHAVIVPTPRPAVQDRTLPPALPFGP